MKKQYHCDCGRTTGERCNLSGPLKDMVILEWMPESLRESHRAARNSGTYPTNGAERLLVDYTCAIRICDEEDEEDRWAWVHSAKVTVAMARRYAREQSDK